MTTAHHSPDASAPPPAQSAWEGREIVITRMFDAPRDLVFKAWTDPAHMAQWWGPAHFTNPVCELDVRPGGAIRIDMQGPDGVIYPMKGIYREVVALERISYTNYVFEDAEGHPQLEVLTTVTFADQGGKTKLTVQETVIKARPAVEGALAGMEEGMNQSLDKLSTYLAQGDNPMNDSKNATTSTMLSDREFVMSRVFDAPRDLVFRACTDPALIPQWWGPRRMTTLVDQMDVRPGGAWRFVQTDADGSVYAFRGEYREVVPPERMVQTFEWEGMPGHISVETMTLEELDGKTRMTTHAVYATAEDAQGVVQSGMEEGARETWERLAELLSHLKTASTQ
jgi:uncharacterized protein YndB with AHSA1/START domain